MNTPQTPLRVVEVEMTNQIHFPNSILSLIPNTFNGTVRIPVHYSKIPKGVNDRVRFEIVGVNCASPVMAASLPRLFNLIKNETVREQSS